MTSCISWMGRNSLVGQAGDGNVSSLLGWEKGGFVGIQNNRLRREMRKKLKDTLGKLSRD